MQRHHRLDRSSARSLDSSFGSDRSVALTPPSVFPNSSDQLSQRRRLARSSSSVPTLEWQGLQTSQARPSRRQARANSTTNAKFVQQVVALTNSFRQQNGLSPLRINQKLTTAAQSHSRDMALNDFFSHTAPNGSSPFDRISATGYRWFSAAENIAAGYRTPNQVVNGWMNSPGHRQNILNPSLREIGVGYFFLQQDTGQVNYNTYWTQAFGSRTP